MRRRAMTLSLVLSFLPFSGCGSKSGDDGSAGEDVLTIEPQFDSMKGGKEFSGTISFPEELPKGRAVQIGLSEGVHPSKWGGNIIESLMVSKATRTVRFIVKGIKEGSYTLFARADASGDGQFGSGDLGGYYEGTTAAAVQEPEQAKAIEPGAAALPAIDFGLGRIP